MLALVNEILREKGLTLKVGPVVDATLISAPSSTNDNSGKQDPEMHQTQKSSKWYFGMEPHIGVDAESGLVHMAIGTAANVHDIAAAEALLHGEETDVYADAGYRGIEKPRQVTVGLLMACIGWSLCAAVPGQESPFVYSIACTPGRRLCLGQQTLLQR
jgi:IS5 family transposase